MPRTDPADNTIVPVHYAPPPDYCLDLEIFSIAALRKRAGARMQSLEHIDFYLLIYLTQGQCTHMIDFESIPCRAGSLLVLHPGQIQRFDTNHDWQGWMLIFRPEFLQPFPPAGIRQGGSTYTADAEIFGHLEQLPPHLALSHREQQAVGETITRMQQDAKLQADPNTLHLLLRSQLHALLVRLHLVQDSSRPSPFTAPAMMKRFIRYRLAVDEHFRHWHRVADYAKQLGCTEKTLGRATRAVAGISAKAFLSKRIALEAKRLLCHTATPIGTIASTLGFDEAANFVNFFRREAGCSPGEFRRRHAGV